MYKKDDNERMRGKGIIEEIRTFNNDNNKINKLNEKKMENK